MTDEQILELASEYFVVLNPFGGFDFKEYATREDGILKFARVIYGQGLRDGYDDGYNEGVHDGGQ